VADFILGDDCHAQPAEVCMTATAFDVVTTAILNLFHSNTTAWTQLTFWREFDIALGTLM
jgi:hypothetical protein